MSNENRPPNWLTPTVSVVGAAIAVLAIGLTMVYLLGSGNSASSGIPPAQQTVTDTADPGATAMPDYVMSGGEDVRTAYQFAMEHPDIMMWMPCYCGCGQHSGHKSAKNCFIKEGSTATDVQFDEHGASCQICVGIALDTKAMTAEGRSLQEIRTFIDETYGDVGPGTDTPLPPA